MHLCYANRPPGMPLWVAPALVSSERAPHSCQAHDHSSSISPASVGILKQPPAKRTSVQHQCVWTLHRFHFNVLQNDLIFLCHPPNLVWLFYIFSYILHIISKTETDLWSSLHLKVTDYCWDVYPNSCSIAPVWAKSHIYHNNALYDRCIWHITIY